MVDMQTSKLRRPGLMTLFRVYDLCSPHMGAGNNDYRTTIGLIA